MDFKKVLYASALSGIVSLSGCEMTLPWLRNPEVRAELEGTYTGKIDGIPVIYTVKSHECILQARDRSLTLEILDYNCDNTADYLNLNSVLTGCDRESLLRLGKADALDSLLERGQKLVRIENKVR
ncbi:MAG: hypothetical protein AABX24_04425 [Nanoarchaeota archaeon]